MVISRESDYAIRILRVLADGELHSTSQMCETELIPNSFAHKIVDKLHKAGLVECTRGKYGGCTLSCDLREVYLYDLLQIIDNECYVNLCLTPGYVCPWQEHHPEACRVHQKLSGLQSTLDDTFKNMDMYSVMFE